MSKKQIQIDKKPEGLIIFDPDEELEWTHPSGAKVYFKRLTPIEYSNSYSDAVLPDGKIDMEKFNIEVLEKSIIKWENFFLKNSKGEIKGEVKDKITLIKILSFLPSALQEIGTAINSNIREFNEELLKNS
jgi:hypothetical protein